MNIENRFLEIYQQIKAVQPSIEDLIKSGYDEESAKSLYGIFNITFKEDGVIRKEKSMLHSFFYTFHVRSFSPSNWAFYEKVREEENLLVFAHYDTDWIGEDKMTGEIKYVDFYDEDNFKLLAPNFNVFLDVLVVEVEYDKVGYLNLPFTDKMREEYKRKISEILKEEKFISSYSSAWE